MVNYGWKMYKLNELTPNKTRRAQVCDVCIYYMTMTVCMYLCMYLCMLYVCMYVCLYVGMILNVLCTYVCPSRMHVVYCRYENVCMYDFHL